MKNKIVYQGIDLPQKVEILRTFKHLGIIEVTSKTQKKNGTTKQKKSFVASDRQVITAWCEEDM